MKSPDFWQLLILNLPAAAKTTRMRVWRALKTAGAGVLRDGVYLLPAGPAAEQCLQAQAQAAEGAGGSAHVWRFGLEDGAENSRLRELFGRGAEYAELLDGIRQTHGGIAADPRAAQRQCRQLRRDFQHLAAIDFFPGESRDQTAAALAELERDILQQSQPDEPRAGHGRVARLKRSEYQRRLWATRRRLWIDRAASAWLIRRHIDPQARFLWLEDPARCPAKALGFDFDGAAFTHVGTRVSFEVLLASFGLETDAALLRLGTLVHYLDVGGVPVAEAAGLEAILHGARAAHPDDDDALLAAVTPTLDCLYRAYQQTATVDPAGA